MYIAGYAHRYRWPLETFADLVGNLRVLTGRGGNCLLAIQAGGARESKVRLLSEDQCNQK